MDLVITLLRGGGYEIVDYLSAHVLFCLVAIVLTARKLGLDLGAAHAVGAILLALMVNGQVILSGVVPSKAELKSILSRFAN